LLKGRELGVLLVELPLRVGELLLEEVGRAFGRLLALAQILAE
jgi:hypothetical protein